MKTLDISKFEEKLPMIFLGFLSLGFIGYFVFQNSLSGLLFGHIAAICIMGFFGCFAAIRAKRKGYSYNRAFILGFFIPLVFGIISAFSMPAIYGLDVVLTCGGWIVLGTGIILMIYYSIIRKRSSDNG